MNCKLIDYQIKELSEMINRIYASQCNIGVMFDFCTGSIKVTQSMAPEYENIIRQAKLSIEFLIKAKEEYQNGF